ncbi:MAG: hypothetical protein JWM10_677, partial [Myxococcaceae bacterium]|nr:hypothetical protein [Myxococcaceae bacterium]
MKLRPAVALVATLLVACGSEPDVAPDAAVVIAPTPVDGGAVVVDVPLPVDAPSPEDDAAAPDDVAPSLPITGAVCTAGAPPGDAPLRRLTHAEYDRTVRDLLGTALHPAAAFDAQLRDGTLETDVANLTVAPTLLAQYLDAADALAADATATPAALARLVGCAPPRDAEAACVDAFVASFSARAWRRPTT